MSSHKWWSLGFVFLQHHTQDCHILVLRWKQICFLPTWRIADRFAESAKQNSWRGLPIERGDVWIQDARIIGQTRPPMQTLSSRLNPFSIISGQFLQCVWNFFHIIRCSSAYALSTCSSVIPAWARRRSVAITDEWSSLVHFFINPKSRLGFLEVETPFVWVIHSLKPHGLLDRDYTCCRTFKNHEPTFVMLVNLDWFSIKCGEDCWEVWVKQTSTSSPSNSAVIGDEERLDFEPQWLDWHDDFFSPNENTTYGALATFISVKPRFNSLRLIFTTLVAGSLSNIGKTLFPSSSVGRIQWWERYCSRPRRSHDGGCSTIFGFDCDWFSGTRWNTNRFDSKLRGKQISECLWFNQNHTWFFHFQISQSTIVNDCLDCLWIVMSPNANAILIKRTRTGDGGLSSATAFNNEDNSLAFTLALTVRLTSEFGVIFSLIGGSQTPTLIKTDSIQAFLVAKYSSGAFILPHEPK